jgi:CRISPR-associated protein Csb2
MTRYLAIHVRVHDGRYHGDGDELPSPFRLFQALVAGAGISGTLDQPIKDALLWLESLDAPIIASPRMVRGQAVTMFVPNNDLDKFGGDARKIAKTRGAKKVWRPRHFDPAVPWIYAWPIANGADGEPHAETICELASKLYQLGRGIDMAWAWGEILEAAELDAKLFDYDGIVRCPGAGDGLRLACPSEGSLESLENRYQANRFRSENGQRVFVQQPRPSHRQVSYQSPPVRYLFELRSSADPERPVAWPLERAAMLVAAAREVACSRLKDGAELAQAADTYVAGRKPDGSGSVPVGSRVRIIPVPSIGMHYADRGIRRLLVEVPAACPLRADDVRWGFSGVELFDPDTGELRDTLLVPSTDDGMLDHYGVGKAARVFRSVTPVVVPEPGRRRRIEPMRRPQEAKGARERISEASRAGAALLQALRHAGIRAGVESIRLQREPFESGGARVEPFAEGTRFDKGRLWHVEIGFREPVTGPLLIGDGRFVGLGLMAPVANDVPGVHVFSIEDCLADSHDPIGLTRALRRAVMARVQATIGAGNPLPPFFTGHEADGSPLRQERAAHLSFLFMRRSEDDRRDRLMVVAPHLVARRAATSQEKEHLRVLDEALIGFRILRAGAAGVLALTREPVDEADPDLFGRSREWVSATRYVATRHLKVDSPQSALEEDVRLECRRAALPNPTRVNVANVQAIPRLGLTSEVRLEFSKPVSGPLVLGRTRQLGGGLFLPRRNDFEARERHGEQR